MTVFVVPSRDLMPPPQLTRDAPVLDVVHPLVVGVDPIFGHETHLATLHSVDGFLGDALTGGILITDLVHGHKPLIGQHGLNHLTGARATRHHELVLFNFNQQAQGLQVGHDLFAGLEAIHAPVGLWCFLVDGGIQIQNADHGQAMSLAHRMVVDIVSRRDFDHPRAKRLVDILIGNDGHQTPRQGQANLLANQRLIAFILRVNHHGGVAQHRFRSRGGHHQGFAAAFNRIADVPQEPVFLLALHLQVRDGTEQHRVPIDQALASIDQALFK